MWKLSLSLFRLVRVALLLSPFKASSCFFFHIMCGLMSMATIYEYKKLFWFFFFCPRRNDGSHCVTASSKARQKNLEARVCVVPPPRKTGGVSCGGGKGKKRTNVGSSPPSMTNMHRERERKCGSKNGHVSCLFPTRLARREGIFSVRG